jgi:hypothetical protein
MSSKPVDRRAFLGQASLTAGVVIASGVLPLVSERAAQVRTAGAVVECDEFRHVDDMWGHWPRYSHPIPHACSQTETVSREKAEPVDWMWVS